MRLCFTYMCHCRPSASLCRQVCGVVTDLSMLDLCFVSSTNEAHFSYFLGLQYRSTYLLQTFLMMCIWSIRAYHFWLHPSTFHTNCLVALAGSAMVLHGLNFCKIWHSPNYCSEQRKALTFVGDLALCMFTVLLSGDMKPAPFTTSAFVHSVHGWGSVAGGFRAQAQVFLHLINLQSYLIMASQHVAGTGPTGFVKILANVFGLVLINSVGPTLINLKYEARQRALFIKKYNIDEKLQPAWESVLYFRDF